MTLTIFDIVTLTIMAASVILGGYRGFINILINFIGFISSIALTVLMYPYVRAIFLDYISNDLVTSVAAGFTAYIVSLILFTILTSKISLLCSVYTGGFFDKIFGLLAGLIRGFLFVLIIFICMAVFTSGVYLKAKDLNQLFTDLKVEKYPGWLKDSMTTEYYQNTTKNIIHIIPEDVLGAIEVPSVKEKDDDDDIIDVIKKNKNKDGDGGVERAPFEEGVEEKIIDELNL